MKRRIGIFFFLCLTMLSLAACNDQGKAQPEAKAPVSATDLLHHNFELMTVDGEAYVAGAEPVPHIAFGEGLNVSGAVCNQFTGQGELLAGTFMVKQMTSTKKACVDERLNKLETDFSMMLTNGSAISLEGDKLTLNKDDRKLEFTRKDNVQ